MAADQTWTLRHDGRRHRVVASGSARHEVRWYVDDELRAEKRTWEDKVTVEAAQERLRVVYSGLGAPRRATLYGAGEELGSLTGLGGTDLVPEPGSRAAAYEEKLRRHPNRYAALAAVGGVARVVLPILLSLIVVRFAVSLPWPDLPLPDLPSPDLPSIPWPSIPWPDWSLPDWSLPAWVRTVLDKATYVWPVVLAVVLARAEVKRRRDQDEKRRAAERD